MNQHIAPSPVAASAAASFSANLSEKPRKQWHLRLDGAYFETHHASIKGNTLKVYLTLKKMLGRNSSTWPRHSVIAKDAGLSVSTVKRALKELREKGLVTWEHRTEATEKGHQKQISNRYFLAQIDLPSQSKLSDSPRSKRATEQRAKKKFISDEQTGASPEIVVASSSKDEIPLPSPQIAALERELESLAISNATTRAAAAANPVQAQLALKQLRKKIGKGGIQQGRHNYFMGTLAALVKDGKTPPPQNKPQSFLAPECSDAPAVEYAPSEADIAMEREARGEVGTPRVAALPLDKLLVQIAPEGAELPVALFRAQTPTGPPTRPDEVAVRAAAKTELRSWPEKVVVSMRQRLAPGYSIEEWETIVHSAAVVARMEAK